MALCHTQTDAHPICNQHMEVHMEEQLIAFNSLVPQRTTARWYATMCP